MFKNLLLAASLTAAAAYCAPNPFTGEMVVTVQSRSGAAPAQLNTGEITAYAGKLRVPVTNIQKLDGANAGMQLFILLDDSTASSSLGVHLPELRNFVKALPSGTEVAIGYMRNGGFALTQGFTADHALAAAAVRLPTSAPGINGSPYFALSYLAKHWPGPETAGRRAVLMLTDGIDRYYSPRLLDDPYVNTAISDVQKKGITVYSIYLRGAGLYPRGGWAVTMGQSRLIQVTDKTGGFTYFQGLSNPVSLTPFFDDLNNRLANQYRIEFEALSRGPQSIKLKAESPGLKITAPARVFAE